MGVAWVYVYLVWRRADFEVGVAGLEQVVDHLVVQLQIRNRHWCSGDSVLM